MSCHLELSGTVLRAGTMEDEVIAVTSEMGVDEPEALRLHVDDLFAPPWPEDEQRRDVKWQPHLLGVGETAPSVRLGWRDPMPDSW